jgi:hypothetical protein
MKCQCDFVCTKLYARSIGVIRLPRIEVESLGEVSNERSAGIWGALIIYALGGVYMLSFWALDQAAYYLALFGIISLLIAGALFKTSRWAWWLGLFSFPIYFVDVAYALLTSVNLVGWYSDLPTGAFHASMVTYLVFLCVGFILLLDRRNVLRSDSILDLLNKPLSSKPATTGKHDSKV